MSRENLHNRPLIGIDLGGTKIEGIVMESAAQPVALERLRRPTESEKGYDHIVAQIAGLVKELSDRTGASPEYIGVATPGTLDPTTQLLKNSNTLCLNGRPLKRDLETALGKSVRMANDANCFAVAEANLGAAKEAAPDARVVFGVIMGTGVGGGVVVDGKVINGMHGIGGEWGHNFLDESGGPCYCGSVGCVEKVIAGPALEKFYTSISGRKLPLKEIVAQIDVEPEAMAVKQRLIYFFGKAISVIVNILDPEVIVLGGGVGNIPWLYTEGVEEAKKHVFNNGKLETLFLRPKLGDSAGVFGAALL